jgi:glycosyltransferase involved in cell wall biosynthesis
MARLAVFIPDMRGGGAERVALTLVHGFISRGHEVDLVVTQATGELLALLPDEVRIVDFQVDRIRGSLRPLSRYLAARRPDALLTLMWPLTVIAVLARILGRSRTRIVIGDHAILSEHYAGERWALAALRLTTSLFYPRAASRVVPSRAIADDLRRLSGLGREAFTVVPNPVHVPAEPMMSVQAVEALWGNASARILAVGALKPEKDYRLLLEAFAALPAGRNARLIIIGEGQMRAELEALAEQLGIADRVAMPGYRADPWPYYASADLFVLSSYSEGFGNVLIEAMSAGLPIVSTDCAGPCEILAGKEEVTIVPTRCREALTTAMEKALSEPADRERLKKRSEQFSVDQAVDTYLEELLRD